MLKRNQQLLQANTQLTIDQALLLNKHSKAIAMLDLSTLDRWDPIKCKPQCINKEVEVAIISKSIKIRDQAQVR